MASENVTPYAGVWIETFLLSLAIFKFQSLLMRECGLKRIPNAACLITPKSLLMRECGLKLLPEVVNVVLACHSLCGSVD